MKVVFLDRDGTVIQEPADERVDKVEKIVLPPDSIEALKYLADNDFSVIIITNQAGIAEGRITEEEFWTIHKEVLLQLAPSGVNILKTYMNGETGSDASEWRKPGPNMLLQAAQDFKLSLKDIYMVGDSESDIQAGINAGCKGGVFIKTARTNFVESSSAVHSASNLLEAAQYVVTNSKNE